MAVELFIIRRSRSKAIDYTTIKLYNTIISKNSKNYLNVNYSGNIAIAFGSENKGLSKKWKSYGGSQICIKMRGKNDSFNLSVSVGIILSEVIRQTK